MLGINYPELLAEISLASNVRLCCFCFFFVTFAVQRKEEFYAVKLLNNIQMCCTYKFFIHKIIGISESQRRVYS